MAYGSSSRASPGCATSDFSSEPRPGSRCSPPASGPRWCCVSFMRAISVRGISRRALRSITPTMPHMALSRRERFFDRGYPDAGLGERALVEVGIVGDHARQAEALLRHLARRLRMAPGGRALSEIGKERARERIGVGGGYEQAGQAGFDQLGVAAD